MKIFIKYIAIFVLLPVLTGLPVRAQWYKGLGKIGRPKTISTATSNSVSRKIINRQQQARASLAALPSPLNKAVFTVKENHHLWRLLRRGTVTAFVIEETYQGKKFLWGVTTPHAHLLKAAAFDHQTAKRLKLPSSYSAGLSDIAVFELPEQLARQVSPLQLAEQNPSVGETLYSVGFFNNEYHVETNRVVQEIGPYRLSTSLKIDRSCARTGACGGPLLNEEGQVVGVHVGSHKDEDIGFAIPVQKIHELLQAIHQGTFPQKPLVFNEQQIGSLAMNQFVRSIEVYRDGKLLQIKKTYLRENEIDYAHLEQFIEATEADELVLTIVEFVLPSKQQKQSFRAFSLTYDLSSGEAVLKKNNLQHTFYVNLRRYLKNRILDFLFLTEE